MRTGLRSRWERWAGAAGLTAMLTAAVCAQNGAGMQMAVSSSEPASTLVAGSGDGSAAGAYGQIVREIDDPGTGDRWLLLRNDQVPGGPGRLVLVGGSRRQLGRFSAPLAGTGADAHALPVIRAGDRLIVVEHTAVVDAVLEARALNPAVRGAALDVRLTIGGRVMRAVALGPGRARLQPQYGVEE